MTIVIFKSKKPESKKTELVILQKITTLAFLATLLSGCVYEPYPGPPPPQPVAVAPAPYGCCYSYYDYPAPYYYYGPNVDVRFGGGYGGGWGGRHWR